jgi:ABC-type branched-subunit amino acid transport system substrate-binding protein
MMRSRILYVFRDIVSIGFGAPFAQVKEVKIGVIYPLSGSLATIGRDLQKAAEFTAESLVNNKNPIC